MKTILTFLFLAITALPAFPQNTNSQREEHFQNILKSSTHPPTLTYDKFKNLTTIDYEVPFTTTATAMVGNLPVTVNYSWNLEIAGLITGKTSKGATNFEIILTSQSDEWRYLKCHDFHWLVDGKAFKYIKEKYENQVVNGGVLENFEIFLTKKQLETLSQAQKIEFEICNYQFSIEDDGIFPFWAVYEKYKDFLKPQKPN